MMANGTLAWIDSALGGLFNETNFSDNFSLPVNDTGVPRALLYPTSYRIVGTVFFVTNFILGFLGNILICVVVKQTRSLHTPTYYYLVSLAVADLCVLLAAIPEGLIAPYLYGRQWIFGHVGCSITVFVTFLSINVGTMNMMAFTVERYIAICRPMMALKHGTVHRSRCVIIATWILVAVYSAPWLGLVGTKPLRTADVSGMVKCDYLISRNLYLAAFISDVLLFYVTPLLVSIVLYTRICLVLYQSIREVREEIDEGFDPQESMVLSEMAKAEMVGNDRRPSRMQRFSQQFRMSLPFIILTRKKRQELEDDREEHSQHRARMIAVMQSRCQVVKMLVVVVTCFALLWLPYRGLLVYNSLVSKPWLDKWYVLFAKAAVYVNSAINPFLYSLLNRRFRKASIRCLSRGLQNIRRLFRKAPSADTARHPGIQRN